MGIEKARFMLGIGVSICALTCAQTCMQAHANPQDPSVQAGQASFSYSANKLDIHQSSNRAVIDWRSFDIAPHEHTQFHQPSSASFTLNRVRSSDPSHINGMLSANGNIAIVNPNGIYFGGSAQIDVGGLIATTTDIDTDNFMNGVMDFTRPGLAGAEIINEGRITARDAGLVGLVAPRVENKGIIQARLGKVQLVSGDTFTLDMAGDGLINVAVSEDQAREIINTGHIKADGGQITLSAAQARESVDSLVVNKGTISANSVGMRNGKIVLSAGGSNKSSRTGNSRTLNEGTIQAKGNAADETGGTIHLLGDHVGVMADAEMDVSGQAGGGEILVGGAYQGGGDTQTSKITYVDELATLRANALTSGNGGDVIIWADDTTRYYGNIFAEGGTLSGNGGFVEVSGKKYLTFDGQVSTLAPNGEDGTLLLDPTDIIISNAVDNNVTGAHPFAPNVDDGPSNLNIATLLTALSSGHVTVQTLATGTQNGDITVADPLSWSANRRLTLNAHNKIIVNAPITARNRLTMIARDVDINANLSEHPSGANLFLQPRANNISVGLAGGAGTFNLSNADLDFIQPGWNRVYIGRGGSNQVMDIGARTWNTHMQFYTRTGELQINGAQDFQNFDALFQTRNMSINNTMSGTRRLFIYPDSHVSVGLAGAAGTLNLSVAELDNIQDGWQGIYIGRTNSNQDLVANAYTWRDPLFLRTGPGSIQIDGVQTMGANNLDFYSRNVVMNAVATGSGRVTLRPDGNRSIGLNGAPGTYQVDSATLSNFTGFTGVRLGANNLNANITANTGTYTHSLELMNANGTITINGDQNVGANNFLLQSRLDPVINGNLIGTGQITLGPSATNVTTGVAGGAGTFNLSTAELDRIQDGWSQIVIGTTGNDRQMDVNAYSWQDNIRFQTDNGIIRILGNQNVGANDLTIRSDTNPQINAALTGTGTVRFETESTNRQIHLGIGGGHLNLSNAELDNITDGWDKIIFGQSNGTGQIRVGARTWNDDVEFLRSTGNVRIDGAQNTGTNDFTITSGAVDLRSTLTGTGTLTLQPGVTNRSVGLAGNGGNFRLDVVELNRIQDGWNDIIISRNDSTAAFNARAYTWNDNITFRGGSGQMRFLQAQNFGANTVRIESDNLRIDQNMTGTGDLTIAASDITTDIGLAGAAGVLNLTSTELDRLSDNWNSITIGRADGTGAINMNAYANWRDPMIFAKDANDVTNTIEVNAAQTNAATSNASLTFNGNTNLGVDLTLDNTDLTFGGPVTLTSNRILDTDSANITFNGAVDGGFDLDTLSTGNISFLGGGGQTNRLATVTVTGANNVTGAGLFNVDDATFTGIADTVDFAGAGLNATNLIDIGTQNIRGQYTATDGLLNSGLGTTEATTTFDTLDISGAGATLLAGSIGGGGATQDTANRIRINGTLMPAPNANYKFAGFTIGYVPPEPVPINEDVTNIILQSFVPQNVGESPLVVDVASEENETEFSELGNFDAQDSLFTMVKNILYIHKDLLK